MKTATDKKSCKNGYLRIIGLIAGLVFIKNFEALQATQRSTTYEEVCMDDFLIKWSTNSTAENKESLLEKLEELFYDNKIQRETIKKVILSPCNKKFIIITKKNTVFFGSINTKENIFGNILHKPLHNHHIAIKKQDLVDAEFNANGTLFFIRLAHAFYVWDNLQQRPPGIKERVWIATTYKLLLSYISELKKKDETYIDAYFTYDDQKALYSIITQTLCNSITNEPEAHPLSQDPSMYDNINWHRWAKLAI